MAWFSRKPRDELAEWERLQEAIDRDLFFGQKRGILHAIKSAVAENQFRAYNEILSQQKRMLTTLYKGGKRLPKIGDMESAIKTSYDRLIEQRGAVSASLQMLQQRIETTTDRSAITIYRALFDATLKEESIGAQEFKRAQDETKAEQLTGKLILDLTTNLEKQSRLIEQLDSAHAAKPFIPADQHKNPEGRSYVTLIETLLDEEERMHLVLLRDERLFQDMQSFLKTAEQQLTELKKGKRGAMMQLLRLGARGSVTALVAFFLARKILNPPAHSRPEIVRETIEQVAHADIRTVIQGFSPEERREITQIMQEELNHQWHEQAGTLIEELKQRYAEELMRQFFTAFQAQQASLEAQRVRITVRYTSDEVHAAVLDTLDFMRPEILRDVQPLGFWDWVRLTGGSPRFTGAIEQHIRQIIMDRVEPRILAVRHAIADRIRAAFIPDILRSQQSNLPEPDRRLLLLFILGFITLEVLLRSLPFGVGKIYKQWVSPIGFVMDTARTVPKAVRALRR